MRADLRIERLDATAADDAVLGEVHELLAAAHAEANAAEPHRSPADTAGFLRHPATPDPRLYWTARAEGALVGFMRLGLAHGYGDVVVRADARRHRAPRRGGRREPAPGAPDPRRDAWDAGRRRLRGARRRRGGAAGRALAAEPDGVRT